MSLGPDRLGVRNFFPGRREDVEVLQYACAPSVLAHVLGEKLEQIVVE